MTDQEVQELRERNHAAEMDINEKAAKTKRMRDAIDKEAGKIIKELLDERVRSTQSMKGMQARLRAIHGTLSNKPDVTEAIAIIERPFPPETECEDCHATLPIDRWCVHCGHRNPPAEERYPPRDMSGIAETVNEGVGK